jgi:hypothetical protein
MSATPAWRIIEGWEAGPIGDIAALPAAERLYAEAGFRLVEEITGQQWGRPVTERRLELSLG